MKKSEKFAINNVINHENLDISLKKIENEKEKNENKPRPDLNEDNEDFITSVLDYINSEIKRFEKKIKDEKDKYKKKNWAINEKEEPFSTFHKRIELLKELKPDYEMMYDVVEDLGGDDLATLANVVQNEAATSNEWAKLAVAYAYLNRIKYKEGGDVREPEGSEISHYKKLLNRWQSFTSDAEKLTFLDTFRNSALAATIRLNFKEEDPTKGATHWVSPKGLKLGQSKNTYFNKEFNKYFPNWARSKDWVEANPKQAEKWFNLDDFDEITVDKVPRNDFIFYKGVK